MAVIKITKDNFETEVMQSDKKVLVDFFATWCGPCKMLSPLVDEVAEESDVYKVCKVDVDENQDLAQKYRVMSVPTLIVIEKGQVIGQSIGLVTKEKIQEMLR